MNWIDQGISNVKQTIERTDHGGELAEKHGLKLEQAYWSVGPYDMVTIFEGADAETMRAHLLEICSSVIRFDVLLGHWPEVEVALV